MLVVTDTSPVNYLVLIGHIDVLPALFGSVAIPQAVAEELLHPNTPEPVRQWIAAPPAWCVIEPPCGVPDPTVAHLDDGEREAIALCHALGADALLTDDTQAVREARARGMEVIRLLDLLERASLRALLDLPTALGRLQETTFYAPQHIIDAMLMRHRQRLSPRQPPVPEP